MKSSHIVKIGYFIWTCFIYVLNPSFALGQKNKIDSLSIIPNKDSLLLKMKMIKDTNIITMANATIQYFIIKAEENTYGYTIFIDGKMVIEQKTIPGFSGKLGFQNKGIAEKVAKLVINKIKDGEMLPTLNQDEVSMAINN